MPPLPSSLLGITDPILKVHRIHTLAAWRARPPTPLACSTAIIPMWCRRQNLAVGECNASAISSPAEPSPAAERLFPHLGDRLANCRPTRAPPAPQPASLYGIRAQALQNRLQALTGNNPSALAVCGLRPLSTALFDQCIGCICMQ